MKRLLATILVVAGCSDPSVPPPASPSPPAVPLAEPPVRPAPEDDARAAALAHEIIIVDGHVDLPHRIRSAAEAGEPVGDVGGRVEKGDFDWQRAQAGGLDAPFMSIYVPARYQEKGGAKAVADGLIDIVEGIVTQHPDKFALARTVGDVEANFAQHRISLPLGIENGAALEGDLTNVAHFRDRGVRYITLTHSEDNDICDSSYDDRHSHRGLTPFGREVVREMNRLGVMIDVSHISDDAFWQVMELSAAPVIASHSSCRHFTPGFERNMSDEMIRRLAEAGGVIMINFGSTFITSEARAWSDAYHERREAFMKDKALERDHPTVKTFMEAYKKDHPLPYASVEDVADHVMHVTELVGIEHVGLGSDFDGVGDSLPEGMKDPSHLPNLFAVLMRRGLSEGDIAKIGGGNLLRVWRAVEQHAAGQRR